MVLSLIIIALGLFNPEHTELSLIGFVFLFLLSLVIMNNNLTQLTGTETNSTFSYSTVSNFTLLSSSNELVANIYTPVDWNGISAHLISYWLAISSVIGFIAVILSLKHSEGFQ